MELFKRTLFSLRMLHCHRHALAEIYQTSSHSCQLCQIPPLTLKQKGVTILVLDFDGVLAAHGEAYPTEELQPWLHECVDTFGSKHVFVLSNKPSPNRIAYFNHHYPSIQYITEVKKSFDADTFFPAFDESLWDKTLIDSHEVDEKHEYPFDIYHYKKKK